MKVNNNYNYDFEESFKRIDEIIESKSEFEQIDEVPNSDNLTYDNGYYFNCYSIFIDIRKSSELPNKYAKKTLAKIYRAYISEIVAIFQSIENCKEINIVGDSVWAIYSAKKKKDVLSVFHAAYASNSIINTLNYKLCKKGINPIKIGIGIDKGSALMIQAGYKGSGIKDIVYMGQVVNQASKLCSKGGKDGNRTIIISQNTYNDLEGYKNNEEEFYQSFFHKHFSDDFYQSEVIRLDMNNWLNIEKSKTPCDI